MRRHPVDSRVRGLERKASANLEAPRFGAVRGICVPRAEPKCRRCESEHALRFRIGLCGHGSWRPGIADIERLYIEVSSVAFSDWKDLCEAQVTLSEKRGGAFRKRIKHIRALRRRQINI